MVRSLVDIYRFAGKSGRSLPASCVSRLTGAATETQASCPTAA